MGNYINKLQKSFPEYKFQLVTLSNGFARIFITYNGFSLGSISIRDGVFNSIKHYKPANYDYAIEDDIFYIIYYWNDTGKRIEISDLFDRAKILKAERTREIQKWRDEHPGKNRRKISDNCMNIFKQLVIERLGNKYGLGTNLI